MSPSKTVFFLTLFIGLALTYQNCGSGKFATLKTKKLSSVAGSGVGNGGLPLPNHNMLFGYYFADGKYGDFYSEVDCYTNLYYSWPRGYASSDAGPEVWVPIMNQSIQRAAQKGKRIYLNLGMENDGTSLATPIDDVLNMVKPYWSQLDIIELADEPSWDQNTTQLRINTIRSKISALGLPPKPLGNVYTQTQVLSEDAIFASGLDWVGLEAYVNPPGSPDSQTNANNMLSFLNAAKSRVPASKNLVVVMQAYARNGAWTNMATLRDLQTPTYLWAASEPRVLALTMFSYGRPSGTREHPELILPHKFMGNTILNKNCP